MKYAECDKCGKLINRKAPKTHDCERYLKNAVKIVKEEYYGTRKKKYC